MEKGLNHHCKEILYDGGECSLKHNRLIHRTSIAAVNPVQVYNVKIHESGNPGTTDGDYNYRYVLLLMQRVKVRTDRGLGTKIPLVF